VGIFSSDTKVKTTTSNTQQGFEEVGGVVITGQYGRNYANAQGPIIDFDGSGNRIEVSDAGAMAAAVQLAEVQADQTANAMRAAVDLAEIQAEANRDTIIEALGVSRAAIEAGVGFGRANLEIARSISDDYRGITRESLDFALNLFGQARDTIAEITADSRSALGASLASNAQALAGAVTEANTSNDARLNQLAQMAFLAVAAVVVLPLIFRR